MEEVILAEQYNASHITVLEGLEAVRRRPGMYIGSTGAKGLNHLVHEILDNAVDEHFAGYCSRIVVTIRKDGGVSVEDNGRGIPVDMHEKGYPAERVIMTTLHAGGKFDNSNYKISGGLHGVGSSVVNALSRKMIVEVRRDGNVYRDEYAFGLPTLDLAQGDLLPVVGKAKGTGTTITFWPDEEIFDTVKFRPESIRERLHETAYLNPELELVLRNERDAQAEEVFREPGGLTGFVSALMAEDAETKILTPVIALGGEKDGIEFSCAFAFTQKIGDSLVSFCNCINTIEGGTHVTGFKAGFAKVINQYARELGNLKEKDANFPGNDTRNGMVAVISVKHPAPRFEGQTKTKLDNQDAQNAVAAVLNQELQHYFDRHLEELKTVISRAEMMAKVRKEEEKIRTNLADKKFAFEGNGKLSRQESSDASKCEIFIVEGRSAAGSAKTGRDRRYQAILPIRGKIINCLKQSQSRVLANEEVLAIVNALGCGFSQGFGNDFDLAKLKYGKIIIMSDADVDGAHISTLLLTLFYQFMPELIYDGHVYRAMPPLYKVTPKKGEAEYLYDDKALEQYRAKHRDFEIARFKGLGEMSAEQLWETTMNPRTRRLKQISLQDGVDATRLTGVLMGDDVPSRRQYIVEHADSANLDV